MLPDDGGEPRRLRRRARRGARSATARVDGPRSSGSSAATTPRRRAALARRSSSTRSPTGSCAATASTSRRAASPIAHVHPGPGIRCLLHGRARDRDGRPARTSYGPGEAWFEIGPGPGARARVAAPARPSFVRVLLLPGRVGGQADDPLRRPGRRRDAEAAAADRAARAADRAAGEPDRRPDPRRPARAARRRPRLRRARRELPRRSRRAARLADPVRHLPARGRRREHGRGLRQAHRPPGDLPGHARARRDARGRRRPHGVPGLDAAVAPRSARSRASDAEREAFQEVDYRRMFGPIAKWVAQIDQRRRGSPSSSRAPSTSRPRGARARSCSRCPRTCSPSERRRRRRGAATRPAQAARGAAELDARARAARRRPSGRSSIVGGQPWSAEAQGGARRVVRRRAGSRSPRLALPGLRRQHARRATSGTSGSGADPRSRARLREADVLLVVGARLGDIETAGYDAARPAGPRPQTLIHVHADPDELGRVYEPALGIVASGPRFASALQSSTPLDGRRRRARARRGARRLPRQPASVVRCPERVDMSEVMALLRERLRPTRSSPTARATSPSGRTASTSSAATGTQLAPTSGAMGYGVPAAVAAKLVHPERDRRRASPATATS